jgi:hypothetical protein
MEKEFRKLSEMIVDYEEKYQKTPFVNIDIQDDQLVIDIENKFEEQLKEAFGDYDTVLSSFFTQLIKEFAENVENTETT